MINELFCHNRPKIYLHQIIQSYDEDKEGWSVGCLERGSGAGDEAGGRKLKLAFNEKGGGGHKMAMNLK